MVCIENKIIYYPLKYLLIFDWQYLHVVHSIYASAHKRFFMQRWKDNWNQAIPIEESLINKHDQATTYPSRSLG